MIDLLLATYDGERFLAEQLASLRVQTETSFRILVRDDGSSDGTLRMLEEFRRADLRLIIVPSDGVRRGACGNFSELLRHSVSLYVMFCDQDDRWDRDKISVTLAAMRELESQHGPATPLLVHTDLRVADAELRTIASSFWRYQHLDPRTGSSVRRLLGQNVVTGSAMMINRALADLSRPIPAGVIMHDWWIALVAAAFGKIRQIDRATADYRQHGLNDTGAKRWSLGYVLGKTLEIGDRRALAEIQERTGRQARLFAERYQDRLPPETLDLVLAYAGLPEGGFLRRRRTLIERGFWKHGWLRNLGLLVRV